MCILNRYPLTKKVTKMKLFRGIFQGRAGITKVNQLVLDFKGQHRPIGAFQYENP